MESTPESPSRRSKLILASTSPFRRELLARLGLPFTAVAPEFAEVAPVEPVDAGSVRHAVRENARGKAASLQASHPDSLILASDQLGECDGQLLTKPGTAEAARAQLRLLSGRQHRLHTAVVLLEAATGEIAEEIVTSPLTMRPLDESRLRRYVELDQPLHSAGSYLSERLGIVLFEELGGGDPTAIVGLPLITVVRMLERFGLDPLGEARP